MDFARIGDRKERGRRLNKRTGITPEMTVREVLWAFPETRAVFDKYGMMGCGGVEGPPEPVEFFAQMHGLSTAELLSELRDAIRSRPSKTGGCALHSDADPCPCGPDSEKDKAPAAS